jgi:uncharacterized protein (TIGR02301 family)
MGRALVVGAALLVLLSGARQAGAQNFIEDLFGGGDRPAARRAPAPVRERAREKPKPKKIESQKRDHTKPASSPPASGANATEAPPPPYEPQMLRLAEILGALSFLRDLCGAGDGDDWRAKMTSLLNAEAPASGPRRQRLTASFNRGFRGYELTYRSCTPNAQTVVARYFDEASHIARDISYRFGNP